MRFAKEPSQNAMFGMIAQPAKVLVHFVALTLVQKCGPCLQSGQTSKTTFYTNIKSIVM